MLDFKLYDTFKEDRNNFILESFYMGINYNKEYKYLFGPVLSRRLGKSLGIDLMPYKTCSLNCIYCECGKTTHLTVSEKEYTPTEKILKEIDTFLSEKPDLDYITFSGSGEPTLHSGLSEIVSFIHKNYPKYRVALLTNGTLFGNKSIRDNVAGIDLIIASFDAATKAVFDKINRPHLKLNLLNIVEGLVDLRKEFCGEYWIEIFIVPGINDNKAEIEKIGQVINLICPDKVQLNSLDRPGTENFVLPADKKTLNRISSILNNSEVITFGNNTFSKEKSGNISRQKILSTIKRRPCTIEEAAKLFSVNEKEIIPYFDFLSKKGFIKSVSMQRGLFFKAV